MKRNRLGRTDLMVSELCLGTMTWGNQNDEAEGHAQIDAALDRGINFLDTAEMYAIPPHPSLQGKTETIIGNWFKKTGRRDDVILATKVAGSGGFLRDGRGMDGPSIREAIEGSLTRLQTDHVDLYQLHWPDRGHYNFQNGWDYAPHRQDRAAELARMHETLETLGDLVNEGKIRHVGVSNESAWGIMHYLHLAETEGLPRIASVQNEYNLIRRHYDLDMAELTHHEDVSLLAYSPLGAGVLTGKYLDGAVPAGSRATLGAGMWRYNEHSEPAIRRYVELAREHGLDPAQMAIAFCLTRPFMTSVIIGATSMPQLETDMAAIDLKLDEPVLEAIEAIHRLHPRPL